MRINKFVAQASGLSRRAADQAITEGRVRIGLSLASLGDQVEAGSKITLDGEPLSLPNETIVIMLNKPLGYVSSRRGQGSQTIYDLLPSNYHELKPVGRLDRDSTGLIILTNDGELANRLTHPRFAKNKIYQVELNKPLTRPHQKIISESGVHLEDGLSKLNLARLDNTDLSWQVSMSEGRNRQIRRTFDALGYRVNRLNRSEFGPYRLNNLKVSDFQTVQQIKNN